MKSYKRLRNKAHSIEDLHGTLKKELCIIYRQLKFDSSFVILPTIAIQLGEVVLQHEGYNVSIDSAIDMLEEKDVISIDLFK
jgi:hypothetical protein